MATLNILMMNLKLPQYVLITQLVRLWEFWVAETMPMVVPCCSITQLNSINSQVHQLSLYLIMYRPLKFWAGLHRMS